MQSETPGLKYFYTEEYTLLGATGADKLCKQGIKIHVETAETCSLKFKFKKIKPIFSKHPIKKFKRFL